MRSWQMVLKTNKSNAGTSKTALGSGAEQRETDEGRDKSYK